MRIKIVQGNKVIERSLRSHESLTIGRSPENDIIVFDERFPKKHTLLKCNNNHCELFLTDGMVGEIRHRNSTLALQDLVTHELLPKKGDFFSLQFSHNRSGYVAVGDAKIAFLYDGAEPLLKDAPSYSWKKANAKALTRDLLFKTVFLVLLSLEIIWGLAIRNIELPPIEPPDAEKVPERFAKFILKQPEPEPMAQVATDVGTGTTQEEQQAQKKGEQTRRRRRSGGSADGQGKKPVTSQGLLGILGGTGESSKTGSAVDFLIGKGLVQELDQLLGNAKLSKRPGSGGLGTGSGKGVGAGTGDGIDDLLNFGLSGGVDDLIEDVRGVGTVDMKKKGQVQIQQPAKLRGSQAAMGRRSPQDVMRVINSQQGRIMYTYNKYLRSDPNLAGKVVFDVTIEANGTISRIVVVEATIGNQDFIRDLRNIIRRLRFPPIQEGSVTVNLPFVFNRAS